MKQFYWLGAGIIVVLIGITIGNMNTDTKDFKNYDKCVEEMQKAIPDANDTEARSNFLQTCLN